MKSFVATYQSPEGLMPAFSQASTSFLWVPEFSARGKTLRLAAWR